MNGSESFCNFFVIQSNKIGKEIKKDDIYLDNMLRTKKENSNDRILRLIEQIARK